MQYIIKTDSFPGILLFFLISCLLVFPNSSVAEETLPAATRLQSVYVTQLDQSVKITVKADGAINDYNAFTLDDPARIVFDMFHIKSPYETRQTVFADTEWVERIRHFAHPDKIRFVLDTKNKYLSSFSAHPVEDGLLIYVGNAGEDSKSVIIRKKPVSSRVVKQPTVVRRIQSVFVTQFEDSAKITVKARGEISDYKAFTLKDPARIVFDLFNVGSDFKTKQTISADTEWVERVRHFAHPDKIRIVLDTKEKYLSSFSAQPVEDGLLIYIGKESKTLDMRTEKPEPTSESRSAAKFQKPVPVLRRTAVDEKAGALSMMKPVTKPAPITSDTKLTLKQIITNAIRANINLKSLHEATKSALALKKMQRTAFLPTLRATYQIQHAGEAEDESYYLLLYGDFPPQDIYSFVGTVTQPLFAGFSLINQYQVAKLGLNISELNEKLFRQTVIFSAKQGYFSLLKAQKLLTVSQLAVKQLDAHTTVANNFYQVGMIPLNDLLKAQVELANATQNLVVVQNGLNIAKSNLNLILRRDINAPIEVVDVTLYSPYDKDIDYCLQTAEDNRLEIRIADLDVKMKGKEVNIAKKDYYPTIGLRANVYQRGADWDVNGGNRFLDGNSWDASAVATWNFWEWGRSYQGIKARKAGLKQSQLKRDDIFDNIRLEVKQAYLRTKEGEKNITTVQKAIEQAKENFRISEERYKEQMVTSTDVLDAQTLLSRTMNNYFNALYDFKISKASLYKAMGQEVME